MLIGQGRPFVNSSVRFGAGSKRSQRGADKLEALRALNQQVIAEEKQKLLSAEETKQAEAKKQKENQYQTFKKEMDTLLKKNVVSCDIKGKRFHFSGQEILDEILKIKDGFGQTSNFGFLAYPGKDGKNDIFRSHFIQRLNMPESTHEELSNFLEALERTGFIDVKFLYKKTHYGIGSDPLDYDIDTYEYRLSDNANRFLKEGNG